MPPLRRHHPPSAWLAIALASLGLLASATVHADEPLKIEVELKDHAFAPSQILVPAGKPLILSIHNADDSAEEFDSPALRVEKVIAGGGTGTVRLRPLGPGSYPFTGEYHPDMAHGTVTAR